MSRTKNTAGRLPQATEPIFVNGTQALAILGAQNHSIVRGRLAADAWSQVGDELQPLYLRSNVEAAMKPGGALDPARIRRGRPRPGQEARQAEGPHRVVIQRRPVEVAPEVEVSERAA